MIAPSDELRHALNEVSFLRAQLGRATRESQLRLELLSSEHAVNNALLQREQDAKLLLVEQDCEEKLEALRRRHKADLEVTRKALCADNGKDITGTYHL